MLTEHSSTVQSLNHWDMCISLRVMILSIKRCVSKKCLGAMGTQLKRPQSVKSLENYVGYVNSQNKIPR